MVAVVATGALLAMNPRPARQPINFNHRLHVEDSGLECGDCHLHALTGVRATIPNVGVCLDCHDEVQTESPEEAKVVAYVQAGEPIPWRKVYLLPDHVYFSHRRHTTIAGLECEVCHGPVGERVDPVSRPFTPMTMDACMECHDASGASNDCIYCHF
jgi:hypothetical protein